MAPGLCVTSFRMLMRRSELRHLVRVSCGLRLRPAPVAALALNSWNTRRRAYCTDKSEKYLQDSDTENVCVEYIQGLPHLTVPLPSRNEKCRFALKPVSHKVGDLIDMLKTEDRGIDRAAVLNESGVRIASTCNIESLMDEPFWLHINDQKYKVIPPPRDRIKIDDLSKLGDVRALVAQLYEALHVGEYHLHKEQEMKTKLEDLKYKIAPLERQKAELSVQAERRTNIMTWVGLGLMSVQFGILARLTWWEYSWDIMEPVTYFVTYGTAMAMYAYFCITKTEYNMPEVKDRHYLLTIHKRAKRINFDVDEYNSLKRRIAEIEYDLRRLHDPLNMQLPPHIDRSQQFTLSQPPTSPPTSPPNSPSSPSSSSSSSLPSSSSSSSSSQSCSKPALTTRISNKKAPLFKIPFLEPKD